MVTETKTVTLNEHEASKYIGMSRSWLAQARMRGDAETPPYLKIGRSIRYLRSDLDQWLADRRRNFSAHGGDIS